MKPYLLTMFIFSLFISNAFAKIDAKASDKNEAGIDVYEHFYSSKADCEKMRAQLIKESEQ